MHWRKHALAVLTAICLAGCNQATTDDTTSNSTVAVTNAAPADNAATPAAASHALVRAVHAVPGAGPMALLVDDKKVVDSVDFGNASQFTAVDSGDLKIKALGADGKSKSGPMPVKLDTDDDLTVVINGVPGDIAMLPFKHHNPTGSAGTVKVAFLHAAKGLPGVDILIDGARFRGDVKYGVSTEYKELKPGRHHLEVAYTNSLPAQPAPTPIVMPGATPIGTLPPVKPTQRITLKEDKDLAADKVYSVVVFYDAEKLPKLLFLEDQFGAAPALPPTP